MRLSIAAIKAVDVAAQKWVDAAIVNESRPNPAARRARHAAFYAFHELLHSDLPELKS